MRIISLGASIAVAGLLAAAPVHAQWSGAAGVGLRQFTVSEFDRTGRRLVREQGWLPGLELGAAFGRGRWTVFGDSQLYDGAIDYDGQTQNAAAFKSSTDTRLIRIRSGASYAFSGRIALNAALEWERWGREIRGNRAILGMQERSTANKLSLGLQTRWPIPGVGSISADAALLRSGPEKLRIAVVGVFDEVQLETKPATGFRIAFGLRPDRLAALELKTEVDSIKVGRSDAAPVFRNGQFAGSATQPEHTKSSITVSARYFF
jgi:hypothetical protein